MIQSKPVQESREYKGYFYIDPKDKRKDYTDLTTSELPRICKTLVGMPVGVEHNAHFNFGTIKRCYIDGKNRAVVVFTIDDINSQLGASALLSINDRSMFGLSLSHNCRTVTGLHVALCGKPLRDDCFIFNASAYMQDVGGMLPITEMAEASTASGVPSTAPVAAAVSPQPQDDAKQPTKRPLDAPDVEMNSKRTKLNDSTVGVPDQRFLELQAKFAALEQERDNFTKQSAEATKQAAETSRLMKERDATIEMTKDEYIKAIGKRCSDKAYLELLKGQTLDQVRIAKNAMLGLTSKKAAAQQPAITKPAPSRVYSDRYGMEDDLKQAPVQKPRASTVLDLSDICNASAMQDAANRDMAFQRCYADIFSAPKYPLDDIVTKLKVSSVYHRAVVGQSSLL